MCWACDPLHYNRLFHPRRLPSVSQFSRRLRSRRVQLLLEWIYQRLARDGKSHQVLFMDGKALPVSEVTQDRDARTGRGNGAFSRGYKLHALGAEDGRIKACCVRPLNEHEIPVAIKKLVPHVDHQALVLADGNYDGNRLYLAVQKRGASLFTPLRGKPARKNRRRRMCRARQVGGGTVGTQTQKVLEGIPLPQHDRTDIQRPDLLRRRPWAATSLGTRPSPRDTVGKHENHPLPRPTHVPRGTGMSNLHAKSSMAPIRPRLSHAAHAYLVFV
jgi:hypothetical protein